MSLIAPTLQGFFTERLVRQRQASPATVASYRDSLRLLVGFVAERTGKAPSALDFDDLDVDTISAFLAHLETDRHNTARTRNNRLAAIRALFGYAALRHPEHAELIARVLAVPQKRHDKAVVTFLTHDEAQALLAAPDAARWEGRRDRAMLAVAIQTGLRLAELTGLDGGDIALGAGAHLSCTGKGRKQRIVPLTTNTVAVLRTWTRERDGLAGEPLFPTRTGRRLSPDAVQRRVDLHVATASGRCPSLAAKNVTPHVLRHTAAMALLQSGVDVSVIALWLGHGRPVHPGLPPRRPCHQGTSPRPHHPDLGDAGTIPALGPAPRLPRKPVIMPTPSSLTPSRSPPAEPPVGIIPLSA